jgi:cytochrome c biogenesis protein CcmG/thiol:disulfide interchange protein DsbE
MLTTLRISLLLGLLTAGTLIVYRERSAVSAPVTATNGRKAAPDFTLNDARGAAVRLSDYKGKVVVLNFWATWCGPCKVEIPWFIEFENAYKDRGFEVLGVSMDEDGWKAVKPYIEEKKMNYRVVVGDDALAQKYGGVDSLPTTFVIDRDGKIATSHMGLVGKSTYEKEIVQLLGRVN